MLEGRDHGPAERAVRSAQQQNDDVSVRNRPTHSRVVLHAQPAPEVAATVIGWHAKEFLGKSQEIGAYGFIGDQDDPHLTCATLIHRVDSRPVDLFGLHAAWT
jgi:hypothetical protein